MVPVIDQFKPELVMISAGFDAHERDPLASMRVTTAGYASIVARLMTTAGKLTAGSSAPGDPPTLALARQARPSSEL